MREEPQDGLLQPPERPPVSKAPQLEGQVQQAVSTVSYRVHPAARRSLSEPAMLSRPLHERPAARFPLMGQTSLQETGQLPQLPQLPEVSSRAPPRFPLMGQLSLQELLPPRAAAPDGRGTPTAADGAVPAAAEESSLSQPLDWQALVSLGDAAEVTSPDDATSAERPNLERWREKLRQRGLDRWKEKLRAKRAQDEERESWARLELLVQRLSPVHQPTMDVSADVTADVTTDVSGCPPSPDNQDSPQSTLSEYENSTSLTDNADGLTADVAAVDCAGAGVTDYSAALVAETRTDCEKPSLDQLMAEETALMASLLCGPGQTLAELDWRSPSLRPQQVSLTLSHDPAALEPALLYESPLYRPPDAAAAADTDDAGQRRTKPRRRRRRRLVRSESAPVTTVIGGDTVDANGVCLCPGCGDVSPVLAGGSAEARTPFQWKSLDSAAPQLRQMTPNGKCQHPQRPAQKRGRSQPNLLRRSCSDVECRYSSGYPSSERRHSVSSWAQRHLDMIEEAHVSRESPVFSGETVAGRRQTLQRLQRSRYRRSYPAPELDSDEEVLPPARRLAVFRSASIDSGACSRAASEAGPTTRTDGWTVEQDSCPPPGSVVPRRSAARRCRARPHSVEVHWLRERPPAAPLSVDMDSWQSVGGQTRRSAYLAREAGEVGSGGGAQPACQRANIDATPAASNMSHHTVVHDDDDVISQQLTSSSNTSTLSSSNMRPDEVTSCPDVGVSAAAGTPLAVPAPAVASAAGPANPPARSIATQTSPAGSAASSWSDLSERALAAPTATSRAGDVVPAATREATTSMSRRPALGSLRARSEEPAAPTGLSGTPCHWQSDEQMHALSERGAAGQLQLGRPARPLQLHLAEGERRRQLYSYRTGSPAVSPLSTPGEESPLPYVNDDKPPHGAWRPHQRRRSSHLYLEMAARMSCSEPTLDHAAARTQHARMVELQGGGCATRSFSAKQLAEWEALEACRWLRNAGFPQYAQMYEECRCAIDLRSVQTDHPTLDLDSRHALFKRINTVNRATNMKLEGIRRAGEESDDDETRAISDNWSYLRHSQRWRRQQAAGLPTATTSPPSGSSNSTINSDSSAGGAVVHDRRQPARRSGRERLQDGASAILRRVESIRARRKRQQKAAAAAAGSLSTRDDSSSYFSASDASLSPRPPAPPCDDSGALSDGEHSPPLWRPLPTGTKPRGKDANSNDTDHPGFLETSSPKLSRRRGGSLRVGQPPSAGWRSSSLNMGRDSSAYRRRVQGKLKRKDDRESSLPPQRPPVSPVTVLPPSVTTTQRGGSFDNAPIVVYNRSFVDSDVTGRPGSPVGREGRACSSPQIQAVPRVRSGSCDTSISHSSDVSLTSTGGSDHEQKPRSASVVRWHSFNRSDGGGPSRGAGPAASSHSHISRLSSGQIQLLKKHALLRITATMERHCPSRSSSWGWDLPKFMRKLRVPDYKGRLVFGVPLTVSARRSGHPLPPSILQALDYLRQHALDQTGLFRKSGVRSRIQKVRDMCETTSADLLAFDDHQAYDIADMVKQYFRELPEVLLTNKISEILIAIYQYVPTGLRLEATKYALMLLPDESRLALQTLLTFLSEVAAASYANQMTAHNLAVCLAPSLFSVTSQRSASASPRRTRKAGVPDQRELNENRAAHECLAALIRQADGVFCLPEELLAGCRFSYLDISQPVSLSALGTEQRPGDWRAYADACCAALLRETRDRPRGWATVTTEQMGVELAFRKVGDGHQLRLWRAATELEAPPQEVVHRLLRQRHAYNLRLVKWRVVERLAEDAEVFQYTEAAPRPLPAVDFCVLRAWRSDLPRGACAIVETSVEHPESPVQPGARRGVVLASRYLIEPCGAGKSRVTHFSRADHRACSPEWYNKVYGHLCGLELSGLRQSFRHTILGTAGPESRV